MAGETCAPRMCHCRNWTAIQAALHCRHPGSTGWLTRANKVNHSFRRSLLRSATNDLVRGAVRVPGRHCPHGDPNRGDFDTRMAWSIPGTQQQGAMWIHPMADPDQGNCDSGTGVVYRDAIGAGQFMVRASSIALASAASGRRLSLVVRPWLAMAARKWSAVMARSVGWFFSALASFTQSRAARWQV